MLGRRVGGFRPLARAGGIASIALIGMLLSANAAFAATEIGSPVGSNPTCGAGFDTVQLSWSSGTYEVPAGGGFITSWTTQTGPVTGAVGLQVWRPLGTTPQTYQLIGASPLETNLAASSVINIPLATKLAVNQHDLIGLRLEGRAYCQLTTGSATDVYGSKPVSNPAVGAIDTFPNNNSFSQLDVAATVEAVITPPPPPPPPSGCDSTNNSTDRSNGGSNDNSATSSADTSAAVAADTSTAAPPDTSNVDSTDRSTKDSSDQSTKDSSDQSKKDKPAKDHSTGGDNCQQ